MAENTINDFNTLPEQVQINKEDIKKLSDSSNAQTEQLQTLSTKVDTNTSKVDTNTTNIATNTSNIATNTSNIASNTESIDSIKQSYLLKSDASNIYATKTELNNDYLNKTDASNTYVTKTHANATYVTKTHADATYVTIQDYNERIDTGDIQFTTQGWTKFKAITDTEGQTITLSVPGDLLIEHVQVTGIDDLKLQLIYNGHAVFENVYLHPNNSINNLDYIAGTKSTYFTGQAVLTLATQSQALFYIVYQETTGITLQLITTI